MTDNKLIAEFDCWKLSSDGVTYMNPQDQDDCWLVEDMMFHTSWEWLMPVVDKIEDECILRKRMGDNLQTSGYLWFTSGYLYQCGTITEVYEAVAEFIKFYNQNK